MRLASVSSSDIVTTRLVSARAALAVLHAAGVEAHVERRPEARRVHYHLETGRVPARLKASLNLCCRRSRLRGAFLVAGRVNKPDSAPHLEIDCATAVGAAVLEADAAVLEIETRTALRRGQHLLLARTADSVAGLLSCIGAQAGRLEFEEGRVVREVRAGVNRRLNAETANLGRTVTAAVRQVIAIKALRSDGGRWEALPPALLEAAELRLRLQDEPLSRLAKEAGCSRPAMAGRLSRLMTLAAGL